jgi:hypothetical protein
MIKPIFVGQLEVIANCDLVEVLHREAKMHPVTHTFAGSFESKPHWTPMTPDKARDLARALETIASQLDAISEAKSGTVALQDGVGDSA